MNERALYSLEDNVDERGGEVPCLGLEITDHDKGRLIVTRTSCPVIYISSTSDAKA